MSSASSEQQAVRRRQRDETITRYRPLVERIARQMLVRLPANVTLDDLVGAGTVGLIEAVDRFDPGKQSNLAAFARMRIKGAMLDELRDLDMLPRSVRDRADAADRKRRELEADLGRKPTHLEIAEAMGLSLKKYEQLRQKIHGGVVIGFDDLGSVDDPGGRSFIETVESNDDVDSEMRVRLDEVRLEVSRASEQMPERWQLVLHLYYVDDLNMREIAAVLGVTEGRISQLHSAAIKTLREHLSDDVSPEEVRLAFKQ